MIDLPKVMIRGREVTVVEYYACECGAGQGCLIQVGGICEPYLGGMLMPEGVLVRTERPGFQGWDSDDTEPVREVGRVACTRPANGPMDHVFYEWRWAS